jgi:cytochrome P450
VPGRLPRIVPAGEPLIVDGKHIPRGVSGGAPVLSIVGLSAYNMHFAESLWGADAQGFNPGRWLNRTGSKLDQWLSPFLRVHTLVLDRSKGHFSLLPSVRIINCARSLALAEIRMTIAVLFRRFEFSLPPAAKLTTKYDSFTVHLASPRLLLKCKSRRE